MIKFFRQIRQRLLSEGRLGKYLLYALGEIVLVVIGILIALQINNWNEGVKAAKTEKLILKNLNQEFAANKESLQDLYQTVENAFDANKRLMALFNRDREYIKQFNTDSLIFHSVEFDRFAPSENVLQDLVSSGRLDIISDERLRNSLFDWSRILKKAEERYQDCNSKLVTDLTPYISNNHSFKDVDVYGNLAWAEKSTFDIDKLAVFEDFVYENLTDDFMYRIDRYLIELNELKQVVDNILMLTDD